MKFFSYKRKSLMVLLFLGMLVWAAPSIFAAPQAEGVGPTATPLPTFTATLAPTAPPEPTLTPTLEPTTVVEAAPTEVVQATSEVSNVPESSTSTTAAGSSILGFLLCTGVLIVAGLAALNIWARRRP